MPPPLDKDINTMKLSRRKFARNLLLSSAAAPLAAGALADSNDQATAAAIDLDMKVIDVTGSPHRLETIREALKNTTAQVAAIRAYPVKRDTQPALVLSVFDA
jgi:hypothetical protein